jgi:hypothetical protein
MMGIQNGDMMKVESAVGRRKYYRYNDDDNGRNERADGHIDAVRVVQMERQWRLEFQFAVTEPVMADRSTDHFVVLGFVIARGHQICVNSIIYRRIE